MKMRCFGCGVEKDTEVDEFWTEPDDMCTTDVPIAPLSTICVQSRDPDEEWRTTVVCNHCLFLLQPDAWISQDCWEGLGRKLEAEGKKLALDFYGLAPNHDEMCGTHDPEAFADLVKFS